MRIYDLSIAKFLSVDPLTKQYPELTPYQFASNTPIQAIDLDGGEAKMVNTRTGKVAEGPLDLTKFPSSDGWKLVYLKITNQAISPITINNPHKEIIAASDMYGNGHIGERSVVLSNIKGIRDEYRDAVGENIKGGLFGALGYYTAGEKGTFVGAAVDGVLMSFAGIGEKSSVFPSPIKYTPINSPATTEAPLGRVRLENAVNLGTSYKAVAEVTAPLKLGGLLKVLNNSSKGDWVKVYEAGLLNGKQIETHYFRNNNNNKVFDVKIKYQKWHQKEFKNLKP
jgi:hypothetical protein